MRVLDNSFAAARKRIAGGVVVIVMRVRLAIRVATTTCMMRADTTRSSFAMVDRAAMVGMIRAGMGGEEMFECIVVPPSRNLLAAYNGSYFFHEVRDARDEIVA